MKQKLFTLFLALVANVGISFAAITVRLHSHSCENWNDVYLYAWEGTHIGAWPGLKLELDQDDWYSYTFADSVQHVNIIWTNRTDQTIDIRDVTESTCYVLDSTSGRNITVSTLDCSVTIGKYQIDNLYYYLDGRNLTAEVTCENSSYPYWSSSITTGNILSAVTYKGITYHVTSIGDDAFRGCSSLTSIEIPNSVTSIENEAFYGCSSLTSISVGENVTSIGTCAFMGCTNLCSVVWNARNVTTFGDNVNPFYRNVHYEELNFDLRPQITSFTFGDEVEVIPANLCLGMTNLTSLTIPNNVTSIGNSAFYNCSGLTSIEIPNSVTSIGDGAFMACEALTSLSILNPDIQNNDGNIIFDNCLQLRKIIAPACIFNASDEYITHNNQVYFTHNLDSIVVTGGQLTDNALWFFNLSRKTMKSIDMTNATNTDLPDEAFKEFYNLTSLQLPANLTHIGYKLLAECVKLKSIDIPASVTEIDDRALEDCRSLETITFGGVQPSTAPGRQSAAAVGSKLRRIGNWAFYNAHELQHLQIPEGVTEIGDGAFYGCTYLEDLVLPSSVQSIGDNCFALCSKLNKIVVNAVTPPTIWNKTFYDVKRQIPVYVPDDCVNSYESDALWSEFDIQGISNAPTDIDNVTISSLKGRDRGRLVFQNGQIFILRGDKIYTVQGQEVK